MGSVVKRPRKDGSIAYRADVVIRHEGKRHQFVETFSTDAAARRWIKKKETQLKKPGAMDAAIRPKGHLLSEAIDRYVEDNSSIGRTKAQVLRSIKDDQVAGMRCADITSDALVSFARRLRDGGRKPPTVMNYMSHLSAVFAVGRLGYGFELDYQAMKDAMMVCKRLGLTSKATSRTRRPSIDEMNRLMTFFSTKTRGNPMHVICAFALFSTRRQEEITRIHRDDYDRDHKRILVRDMKNPGQKIGNDIWCELPDEAIHIIDHHGGPERLFPYNTDAISASFTRACKFLEIEDLHFHDLRHEGISRLFEMGRTIPQVASVSGHRSWQSLQGYSHIQATGDKWDGWIWFRNILEDKTLSR